MVLHQIMNKIDNNTISFSDYHVDYEKRKELLHKIYTEIQYFGFMPHFVSFYDYIHNSEKIVHLLFTEVDTMLKTNSTVLEGKNKNISHTYRNDLKNIQVLVFCILFAWLYDFYFRRQLLIDAAKYFECNFVFTPEISVDISAQLLTNVSLGRGSHIPVDTVINKNI